MRKVGRVRRINHAVLLFTLTCVGFCFLFPFIWMILSTFRTDAQIFQIPPRLWLESPHLGNYQEAFSRTAVVTWFANSLQVSVVRVLLSLFLCSLAAFAFAKYEFPLKNALFLIMLSTMMIPFQSILIPLYVQMIRIKWVDTYLALWVPWMASAFGTFLLRQYMLSIPDELVLSARIDGASDFRIYAQVIVPLAKPGLGALAIIIFLQQWRNYMWPLIVLTSARKFTLPIGLAAMQTGLSTHQVQWGVVFVIASLVTVPILIVFLALQKQFIYGMTVGSIKG